MRNTFLSCNRYCVLPRRGWQMILGLVVLTIAACGHSDRVDVYPVRGSVVSQGESAVGALVVLHPLTPVIQNRISAGTVDETGEFAISTYGPYDGAPAGEYRVTVVWPSIVNGLAIPDRFNGLYADSQTTPLKATVTAGENHLEPFDLLQK